MRNFARILMAVLFFGTVFAPTSVYGTEQATDECSATVWDGTAAQSLDQSALSAQISELQGFGADVRVRVYDSPAIGFVDTKFDGLIGFCDSWQNLDGGMKSNLVVYILTPEEALFVSGTTFNDKISDRDNKDIYLEMSDKNAPAPISAALDATIDQLDGPNSDDPFVIISGIALALLLLVAVSHVVARARHKRQIVRAAQAAAQAARDKAKEALAALHLDPDADKALGVQFEFSSFASELSQTDREGLEQDIQKAVKAGNDVMEENGTLSSNADMDPDREHDVATYERIQEAYEALLANVLAAQASLDNVTKKVVSLKQRLEATSGTLEDLQVRHRDLVTSNEELLAKGYRSGATEKLLKAQSMLAKCESSLGAGKRGDALGIFDQVEETLEDVDEELSYLSAIRETLVSEHTRLMTAFGLSSDRLKEASIQLDELQRQFSDRCSSDLVGLKEQATISFYEAKSQLILVEPFISMERQEWQRAAEMIDSAEAMLGPVEAYATAVADRASLLAKLRETLPGELNSTKQRIDVLTTELQTFEGRQEENIEVLRTLSGDIDGLVSQCQHAMPDYPDIGSRLDVVRSGVQAISERAKNEDDRVKSARAAATRAEARAQAQASYSSRQQKRQRQSGMNQVPSQTPPRRNRKVSMPKISVPRSKPKISASRSKPSSSSGRRSSGPRRSSGGGRKSSGRRR